MTEAAPRRLVDAGVDAGDDGERAHDDEQENDDETDHEYILNRDVDHDKSGFVVFRLANLIGCGWR